MIQIVPAIHIQGGRPVKITGSSTKFAGLSPIDLAKLFEDHGVQKLHLIDVDGAMQENVVNYQTLHLVAAYTDLQVNFSGGIRTDGGVHLAFEHGAYSVTVSTIAVNEPELFSSWIISFGREKLILGLDVDNGKLATKGWKNKTTKDAMEQMAYWYERGISKVKVTDVTRDGFLEGPNFELIQQIRTEFPDLRIFASGGVRNMADVEKLNTMGVYAVVIGKAIYEEQVKLEDLKKITA